MDNLVILSWCYYKSSFGSCWAVLRLLRQTSVGEWVLPRKREGERGCERERKREGERWCERERKREGERWCERERQNLTAFIKFQLYGWDSSNNKPIMVHLLGYSFFQNSLTFFFLSITFYSILILCAQIWLIKNKTG